jgi:hypothetical protein
MGRTACTEPQCLYKGALYICTVQYCRIIIKRMVQQAHAFLHKQILIREKTLHSWKLHYRCLRDSYSLHPTIDVKKWVGNTANRSSDEICGLILSRDIRNVRKVAFIYMAISILAVACRVRLKYSMFARHGSQTMAGCDVISRDNGLVTSRTNQNLPWPWDTCKPFNAHAQVKGIRIYLICLGLERTAFCPWNKNRKQNIAPSTR